MTEAQQEMDALRRRLCEDFLLRGQVDEAVVARLRELRAQGVALPVRTMRALAPPD